MGEGLGGFEGLVTLFAGWLVFFLFGVLILLLLLFICDLLGFGLGRRLVHLAVTKMLAECCFVAKVALAVAAAELCCRTGRR